MPQPSRWPNNGSRSRLINQGCRWSPRRRESRCLDKHAEKDHQKNGTKTKSDTSHTCQTWNRDNNKKREASFAVDTCHFSNLWSCTKETSSLEILIWKGSSTRQIQRLGKAPKKAVKKALVGSIGQQLGLDPATTSALQQAATAEPRKRKRQKPNDWTLPVTGKIGPRARNGDEIYIWIMTRTRTLFSSNYYTGD